MSTKLSDYFVEVSVGSTFATYMTLRSHLSVFIDWWYCKEPSLQINQRLRALLTLVALLPSASLSREPSQKEIYNRLRSLVASSVLLRLSPKAFLIPKGVDQAPYIEARDAFFATVATLDSKTIKSTIDALSEVEGCDQLIRSMYDSYVPPPLRKYVSEGYPG